MSLLHIRHGTFHVVIDTDAIDEMPRANFRRLMKLAFNESRNASALKKLRTILEGKLVEAESAHVKAKAEFADGWQYINKKSRTKAAIETLQKNNRLHNAVKRTKAELISAESLLKIYNEMEKEYYGSNYS